jgi:hypothetical protein
VHDDDVDVVAGEDETAGGLHLFDIQGEGSTPLRNGKGQGAADCSCAARESYDFAGEHLLTDRDWEARCLPNHLVQAGESEGSGVLSRHELYFDHGLRNDGPSGDVSLGDDDRRVGN